MAWYCHWCDPPAQYPTYRELVAHQATRSHAFRGRRLGSYRIQQTVDAEFKTHAEHRQAAPVADCPICERLHDPDPPKDPVPGGGPTPGTEEVNDTMGILEDYLGSDYLKAEDVPDGEILKKTVVDLVLAPVGRDGDTTQKPVLRFEDTTGLVLNKTNAKWLKDRDLDEANLPGKTVALEKVEVEFQGKPAWGIRFAGVE